MAKTQLVDIITPSVFVPYMVNRTKELARIIQSGIVATNEQMDTIAKGEGRTFNMPFWNDLTGSSQLLSDSAALTPKKITAAQDVAVKHFRGDAWSANDLVKYIAGDDPMRAVADLVASYWQRDMQKSILLPTLQGMFATALASTHVHDVAGETGLTATDAQLIGSDAIIDASGKLGDAWETITAMVMHSVPFRRLQKLDLIEFEPLSQQDLRIPRFLGREIIVDDGMPAVAAATNGFKYTTYLFGEGSVALGEGGPAPDEAIESDRDALASDDILISRRHFIMHPRGVAFTGSVAGATPSNAELILGASWTKRWEDKSIGIVKLVTNG